MASWGAQELDGETSVDRTAGVDFVGLALGYANGGDDAIGALVTLVWARNFGRLRCLWCSGLSYCQFVVLDTCGCLNGVFFYNCPNNLYNGTAFSPHE